jgi:hypothetical protein
LVIRLSYLPPAQVKNSLHESEHPKIDNDDLRSPYRKVAEFQQGEKRMLVKPAPS